jgi:curved DNA-binding protein CbpA
VITGSAFPAILERRRRIGDEDFFQRLGVGRDASAAQVDLAFARLAAAYDPVKLPPELLPVRKDCAEIVLALAEAHQTLSDLGRRSAYVKDLARARQRLTTQRDLAAVGCKDPHDGAKAFLARGDTLRALRLARAACQADPGGAGPFALVAWIEAIDPSNQSIEATQARIAMLDRAVTIDPLCTDALYFRSQLHARLENHRAAIRDLRVLLDIDPSHTDALRAFRLYQLRIRRGSLKLRAVDPSLAQKPGGTSGVVVKVGSVPPGRAQKR